MIDEHLGVNKQPKITLNIVMLHGMLAIHYLEAVYQDKSAGNIRSTLYVL